MFRFGFLDKLLIMQRANTKDVSRYFLKSERLHNHFLSSEKDADGAEDGEKSPNSAKKSWPRRTPGDRRTFGKGEIFFTRFLLKEK